MINILKKMTVFTVLLMQFSCSKDEETIILPTPVVNSRQVKFEVTGNFSSTLTPTYYSESGGIGTNSDITSLPWSKEITYQNGVTGTSINVKGNGGVSGQTITVKVYSGGNEVSSTSGTANNDGIISVQAPAVVFN